MTEDYKVVDNCIVGPDGWHAWFGDDEKPEALAKRCVNLNQGMVQHSNYYWRKECTHHPEVKPLDIFDDLSRELGFERSVIMRIFNALIFPENISIISIMLENGLELVDIFDIKISINEYIRKHKKCTTTN